MKTRSRFAVVLSLLITFSLALSMSAPVAAAQQSQPAESSLSNGKGNADFWPLEDVRVRKAIAYCTDKAALAQAGYPLLTAEQAENLVLNSFIRSDSPYYAGDANLTIYPYNPLMGGALLDAAGWTLQPGFAYRTNANGDELALKFTTTTASFRQAWAAVFEQQMATCGIRVLRTHVPSSWWFGATTGLQRRDFEMGAFAWVGEADPGGRTLFACDQIPAPENYWSGQNYMGWCNQTASTQIYLAVNSLIFADRQAAYKIVQQEYTADVPSIPLFNRIEVVSTDHNLTGIAPTAGEEYYVYNSQDWAISGQNTIVIGTVQEPASLHTLVENTYIANMAVYLVKPRSYLGLNFNFTPQLTTQLSTIENGLALNNTVLVHAGDKAVAANGEVQILALGTLVRDANGDEVPMDADGVLMKQLVVTYPWRNDLKWSDGVSLNIADLQLGYQATCNPANGAANFYTCDRTQTMQFAAAGGPNTYTATYVPGYQDALYFLAPYGYYPAHQVITTPGAYYGFQLKYVPPSAWPTLPELTEKPLGVGAYKIVEWVHGDHITYAANPYAPTDLAPLTPNLILKFVPSDQAENLLLSGQVDVLGWDTLADLSQGLVNGEIAGTVKNYVNRGATWEHIDLNLGYVPRTVKPAADLRVRQAIAYCTDKAALAKAGYPLLNNAQAQNLVMNSFITKESPFYAGDTSLNLYDFDPAAGQALLNSAGWTLSGDGFRYNADGEKLSLKLTTTTAAFRQAWGAEFEQQMRNCGIQVIRQHFSSAWFFGDISGLSRRDFELAAYAWVGQTDPGGNTLWACDQIPAASNSWIGQNFAGWCNPTASQAITRATHSVDRAQRVVDYKTVQEQYTADLPSLPLFNRAETYSAAATLSGFAPTPGEPYYDYNAAAWQIPGHSTIVIGMTQEPASLYTLVETAYSSALAAYLINPGAYLSLNYNYTPQLTLALSTVESGLALNNNVLVHIGDVAADANDNVGPVANGTLVFDMNGDKVVMGPAGVWMKQLVVTYPWRNDLKWSDGVPLSIEDFQLGYQVACDPTSGAASYYTCDRTQTMQFATNGTNTYTTTYVPGYQNPLYYLAPYGYYPGHQIITSPNIYLGYQLKNVPYSVWPSLPELAERPLGVGPYKIVQWVKGDRIEFAANPYAPPGMTPKTANLTIKFVIPEDAEGLLLTGGLDVLGPESLPGLSEGLVEGEAAGVVKNYVIPTPTWEHIDFNLDPLTQAAQVDASTPVELVVEDAQNDMTGVDIPSGAATSTVTIELVSQAVPLEQDNTYQFAGSAFTLTAYDNGTPLADYQFAMPVTVTLEYSDSDLAGMVEAGLTLYYWDEPSGDWLDAANTCSGPDYMKNLDMVNNILSLHICHLSEFATFAPQRALSITTLVVTATAEGKAHLVAMVSEPSGKVNPPIEGQVVFLDGVRELGTVTLVGGTAALDVALSPGWHLLLARFTGNESYDASVSVGRDVQTWSFTYLPAVQR